MIKKSLLESGEALHGRSSRPLRGFNTLALIIGLVAPAIADEASVLIKADNEKPLKQRESWTTPARLDGTEIAQWDATVTSANEPKTGGAIALAGIRLLNPAGPVTIVADSSRGLLTLGFEGIAMNEATQNLTLETPVMLAASQVWSIGSGRQLGLGSGSFIDLGGHMLAIQGGGRCAFEGGIKGKGSLLIRFDLPESVVALSAAAHNGATIVRGGTLLLEGEGALEGTSELTLANGRLEFDGTFLKVSERVPVNLFGDANFGTVIRIKLQGAMSQISIGRLNVRAGESEFEFFGGAPERLVTVENLLRDPNLRGVLHLGGGTSANMVDGETIRFIVTNPLTLLGGDLGTPSARVLPWVTNLYRQPMTYDDATGFRSLEEEEFVTELNGEAAGKNVRVTTPQTLSQDLTVNSFGSTNQVHDLGGNTLMVTSGAIYEYTGSAMVINKGIIDFGSQEGFLSGHIDFGSALKIQGTGGITLLNTAPGRGKTISCPDNEFTGGVWVQDGSLTTGRYSETIPDSNAVFLARPATFLISSTEPVIESIAALAGEGTAQVGDNCTLTIGPPDQGSSPGWITLVAGGTLSPGNNSGATDLLPGTLRLVGGEEGGVSLAGGNLLIDIASPVLHDNLDVKGSVALASEQGKGTVLAVQLGYAPRTGDSFLILANDGTDPVSGQFAGGNQIAANFEGRSYPMEILMNSGEAGGDGNDIVLRFGPARSSPAR